MRLLFLTLLTIISSFSFAQNEECSTVRLDQNGGPLEGVPVSNQTGTNTCYAHSGALMMTAYLQKISPHRPPFIVAPEKVWSQIASLPKEESAKILAATQGRTCEAINLVKTAGACDHEKLLNISHRYVDILRAGFLGFLSNASHSEPEKALLKFKDSIKNLYGNIHALPQGQLCQSLGKGLADLGVSPDEIQEILNITQEAVVASPEHLFDLVLSGICRQNNAWMPPISETKNSPPVCQKFDFKPIANDSFEQDLRSPAEFKQQLHDLFNQPFDQQLPVGIEYCSQVLSKGSGEYITNRHFPMNVDYLNDKDKMDRNLSPDCKFHASAIIGRKLIGGKCHFLIQNSWGASCNFYEDPKKCEHGKIWVDEDNLTKNIFRISHF